MSDATPPTTATANKRAGSPLFAETGANAKRAREGTQQNGSSSAAAGQDTEPNSAESNPNGDAKTKEGEGSATKEQDKTAESNGTGSGTQGSNMNDVNMDRWVTLLVDILFDNELRLTAAPRMPVLPRRPRPTPTPAPLLPTFPLVLISPRLPRRPTRHPHPRSP